MTRTGVLTATARRAWRGLAAAALAGLCLGALPLRASAALAPTGQANLSLDVSFRGIVVITDLRASSGPAGGQITLSWTAPDTNGVTNPLQYLIRVRVNANMNNNAEYNAATPLSAFSASTPPLPAAPGTPQSMVVDGLTPDVVYCFGIKTQDSSFPTPLLAGWFRNIPNGINVFNCAPAGNILPPQSPMGVRISTSGANMTLSWMPVRRYVSGTSFIDPLNPQTFELTGYLVFKASAPVGAPWTQIASVSTAAYSYAYSGTGPGDFFQVKAVNSNGASRTAMVRAYTGEAFLIGYDGMSYMMIPKRDTMAPLLGVAGTPGDPNTAYLVESSSHPETVGGRVLKTINFMPMKGGATLDPQLVLAEPVMLKLRYEQTASSVTPSGLGTAATGSPQPEELSVFWHNGSKWFQLYGKLSGTDQTMVVETPYFGEYQLRQGERLGQFTFDGAGISNRFITPNKDGKNDTIVFGFDNPQGSQISVKIFDMKGALVTVVTAPGPVANTIVWDGTAGGTVVPGGVYIYQIGAEGRSYNGTIVVIK